MTHSKIPKFTKSRPHGLPQTPFNPKTGKYIPLSKDPHILKVVVDSKISGSDNLYSCSVLDERSDKSGETLQANRLTYGSSYLEDIPENTLTFAYKIDHEWWVKGLEDETAIPEVDFIVDSFDRDDADSLGDLWTNGSKWAIRNKHAYEVGTGASHNLKWLGNIESWAYTDWSPGTGVATYRDPSDAQGNLRRICMESWMPNPASALVDVIYNAALSNGDCNIKIISNASVYDYASLYCENYALSNFFEISVNIPPDFQTRGTRIQINAGFDDGLYHPGDAATEIGYFSCSHGGNYNDVASIGADSYPAAQFSEMNIKSNETGSGRNIFTFTPCVWTGNHPAESYSYCLTKAHAGNGSYMEAYKSRATGSGSYNLQEGYNTYYFEIRSGYISMWINSSLIFSSELLYTIDAGMFGLRGAVSSLTAFLNNKHDNHINQVKVWSASVPEPGDESGHGKYIDGAHVYSDKYHAGDDYNPDA